MKRLNETQVINDSGNHEITWVDPTNVKKDSSSIFFIGEVKSDISEPLNSNFLNIVQDFCFDKPSTPIEGQRWFDNQNEILYRFDGRIWKQQTANNVYDVYLQVFDNLTSNELTLYNVIYNYEKQNIVVYDSNLVEIDFLIDPFDLRKIILRDTKVTYCVVMIFHKNDILMNPKINEKKMFITTSGQTQFDLKDFIPTSDIDTITVLLNGILLKRNEYYIENDILNISGKYYNISKGDIIVVYKNGAGFTNYKPNMLIEFNDRSSKCLIPKLFTALESAVFFDIEFGGQINPIEVQETNLYYKFTFIESKKIKAKLKIVIF